MTCRVFVAALAPVIEAAHKRPLVLVGRTSTEHRRHWSSGRAVFAVVPYWLAGFGPYPKKNPDGTRNLLRILGNMPGRCGAGRIWQALFNTFLRRCGLRQLITERVGGEQQYWDAHCTVTCSRVHIERITLRGDS